MSFRKVGRLSRQQATRSTNSQTNRLSTWPKVHRVDGRAGTRPRSPRATGRTSVSSNGLSCHHQSTLVSSTTSHVTTRLHTSHNEPLSFQQVQHISPDESPTSVDSTTFVDLTTDSDFDVQIVKWIPASCCDNIGGVFFDAWPGLTSPGSFQVVF